MIDSKGKESEKESLVPQKEKGVIMQDMKGQKRKKIEEKQREKDFKNLQWGACQTKILTPLIHHLSRPVFQP